jgi:hypothetical protein
LFRPLPRAAKNNGRKSSRSRSGFQKGVAEQIAASCGGGRAKGRQRRGASVPRGRFPKKGTLYDKPRRDAEQVAQRSAMRYDRDGDAHYDLFVGAPENPYAAAIPTRAVYYLARLLTAGGHDFRRAARLPRHSGGGRGSRVSAGDRDKRRPAFDAAREIGPSGGAAAARRGGDNACHRSEVPNALAQTR